MTTMTCYPISAYVPETLRPHLRDLHQECWRECGQPRCMTFLPNGQGSFLSIYCKEHQRAPEVLARIWRKE